MIGTVGSGSNGHCIALNNIGNFLSSSSYQERSKFLIDFSNNDNENIISTEGCFACDMNKPNRRSKSRSGSSKTRSLGRRGKRLRSRRNLKQRHKRNNHNLITRLNTSRVKRSPSIDNFNENIIDSLNNPPIQNVSSSEHSSVNMSHVERIAIRLSRDDTRRNR